MSKNTGGPAFPSGNEVRYGPGDLYQTNGHAGMTLRDYFAAKATEGDIDAHLHYFDKNGTMRNRTREAARFSYADAMLAEREKE